MVSLLVLADKIDSSGTIETKVCKIINDHRYFIISKNHGIKRNNIFKMYRPLGYIEDDFDISLLSDLDTFGSFRGTFAHHSAKKVTEIKMIYFY